MVMILFYLFIIIISNSSSSSSSNRRYQSLEIRHSDPHLLPLSGSNASIRILATANNTQEEEEGARLLTHSAKFYTRYDVCCPVVTRAYSHPQRHDEAKVAMEIEGFCCRSSYRPISLYYFV